MRSKKMYWGIPALVVGMALATCAKVEPDTAVADTWSYVTDMSQVNGTWKLSPPVPIPMDAEFEELAELGIEGTAVGGVTLDINADTETRSILLEMVFTFSGNEIDDFWPLVKQEYPVSDGWVVDDTNRTVTLVEELSPEVSISLSDLSETQINQNGTKMRMDSEDVEFLNELFNEMFEVTRSEWIMTKVVPDIAVAPDMPIVDDTVIVPDTPIEDTWSNVTDLSQINGAWKLSQPVPTYAFFEEFAEAEEMFKIGITAAYEFTLDIHAMPKTVSVLGRTVFTISGNDETFFWSTVNRDFFPESHGLVVDETNHTITQEITMPPESISLSDFGGSQINQNGTKMKLGGALAEAVTEEFSELGATPGEWILTKQ